MNLKPEVQDPKSERPHSRISRLARVPVRSAGLQPAYDATKPSSVPSHISDMSSGLDGLSRSQTGAPAHWVRPKRHPHFQNEGQLISDFGIRASFGFREFGFRFYLNALHASRRRRTEPDAKPAPRTERVGHGQVRAVRPMPLGFGAGFWASNPHDRPCLCGILGAEFLQ